MLAVVYRIQYAFLLDDYISFFNLSMDRIYLNEILQEYYFFKFYGNRQCADLLISTILVVQSIYNI